MGRVNIGKRGKGNPQKRDGTNKGGCVQPHLRVVESCTTSDIFCLYNCPTSDICAAATRGRHLARRAWDGKNDRPKRPQARMAAGANAGGHGLGNPTRTDGR